MRNFALIGILCLFVTAKLCAQPSAALDPNYVTLQAAETFKGEWAAESSGGVINNVGIMAPGDVYGDVFLKSIDTLGYGSLIRNSSPLGLFKGGSAFSLFNRSLITLNGVNHCKKISFRGKDTSIDLISGNNWYPSRGWLQFNLDDRVLLTTVPDLDWKSGLPMHENTLTTVIVNSKRSYNDIIAIGEKILTETGRVNLEYYPGNKNPYHGERFGVDSNKVLSAKKSWTLNSPATSLLSEDVDRDSIADVLFFTDSSFLGVAFGKIDSDSLWAIDTILYYKLPFQLLQYPGFDSKNIFFMDFIWSDSIRDLLLMTQDTIYCYSGNKNKFLRTQLDWLNPDIAIPNPEMLDPVNFKGNGKGSYGWVGMFDGGNANGSGEHSLAVLGGYSPDNNADYGISYCMLYSGGKAADEKADAIFADNSATYGSFEEFDTVQTTSKGILDILVGNPIYDAGGVGKLFYLKGDISIPHRADPRWSKSVTNRNSNMISSIRPLSNPSRDIVNLQINSDGWEDGILTVRDLLGRLVFKQIVFASGVEMHKENLNLAGLAAGVYVIEYSTKFITVSTRCILFH